MAGPALWTAPLEITRGNAIWTKPLAAAGGLRGLEFDSMSNHKEVGPKRKAIKVQKN